MKRKNFDNSMKNFILQNLNYFFYIHCRNVPTLYVSSNCLIFSLQGHFNNKNGFRRSFKDFRRFVKELLENVTELRESFLKLLEKVTELREPFPGLLEKVTELRSSFPGLLVKVTELRESFYSLREFVKDFRKKVKDFLEFVTDFRKLFPGFKKRSTGTCFIYPDPENVIFSRCRYSEKFTL